MKTILVDMNIILTSLELNDILVETNIKLAKRGRWIWRKAEDSDERKQIFLWFQTRYCEIKPYR